MTLKLTSGPPNGRELHVGQKLRRVQSSLKIDPISTRSYGLTEALRAKIENSQEGGRPEVVRQRESPQLVARPDDKVCAIPKSSRLPAFLSTLLSSPRKSRYSLKLFERIAANIAESAPCVATANATVERTRVGARVNCRKCDARRVHTRRGRRQPYIRLAHSSV